MTHKSKSLRVLHSAALLSPSSGMLAQMEWEQEAADELCLDWRTRMYCPKGSLSRAAVLHHDSAVDIDEIGSPADKLLAWVKLRRNYHRWLLQQQDQIDVFLLRYYVHDPYQLAFVRSCDKPVFFVHHTLEVPELALPSGFSSFVRSNLESLLGRLTLAKARGIIGVTQEIVEYEKQRIDKPKMNSCVYPNGIVSKHEELLDKRGEDRPELLFVANFSPWHGLDLLLDSAVASEEDFVLHLVGHVPDDLLRLCDDTRIKLHGHLNHEQIMRLSEQCWLGLASFALFRNEMHQACPLKVREYLQLGLPVCGGYQDVFPESAFYFRETGSDIKAILKFAYDTRSFGRASVVSEAKCWINKKILLQRLHRDIGIMLSDNVENLDE